MTATDDDRIVEVHLLQVPVPLWVRSKQQTDELLREFALAAAREDATEEHHLPSRLTALIETLTARFDGVSSEQEQQLFAAAAAGEPSIDLVFQVPAAAAPASQQLGDMLDEADEYCREGQHLLTLAAPEDVVRFRRWYLWSFLSQIEGAAPTPWPDYDGSWPGR